MTSAVFRGSASIAEFAAERRYGPATIARWERLDAADGQALLALAIELRPSENQLRDLWEWAADTATRDGTSLAAVLGDESLRAVRRRPLARSEKLTLVKKALRRLRFPQLAASEAALAEHVRALNLPRSVRIEFPDQLEGDDLRVSFTARSPDEWAALARALLAAASDPRCAALFETLAEPDGAIRVRGCRRVTGKQGVPPAQE